MTSDPFISFEASSGPPPPQAEASFLFQRRPSPLARCKAAAGSDAGGQLLHQLHYRFHAGEALIVRGGIAWAAQAARCWLIELGMSKHKFEQALGSLKSRGLIEVGLWRIGAGVMKINHIRLTEAGLAVLPPKSAAGSHSSSNQETDIPKPGKSSSLELAIPLTGGGEPNGIKKEAKLGKKAGESALSSQEAKRSEKQELSEADSAYALVLKDQVAKMPVNLPSELDALLEEIWASSSATSAKPVGKQRVGYEQLLAGFKKRARSAWERDGVLPMPAPLALSGAVTSWLEFRSLMMPDKDDWPLDLLPTFALYKVDKLYDFLVAQRDAPPPKPSLKERFNCI